jgi:DNA-binding SARP family transcriptional activator/tetratricopeptide (TPR) repeat protein
MNSDPVQTCLRALGDARISIGRVEIDPSAELVFSVALFLILERDTAVHRNHLRSLLWPGVSTDTASHRLRQTLFKLRTLGFPLKSESKLRLTICTDHLRVDFEQETQLADGAFDPATHLPILAGFEPDLSWEYSEWLDAKKKTIASTITGRLLERIAKFRLEGDWAAVDRDAKALLAISPHNEEATLAFAECMAMRGDKIDAVRILDTYIAEMGTSRSDLRVSANIMRKRIADRMPPRSTEPHKQTPLLGREFFLERLVRLLIEVRNGTQHSVAIWGEPGIGKSRLLWEFFSFASLQGAVCHRIACRSTDANRPLAVLLELIPVLQGMKGAIGSAPETLDFFRGLTTHRAGARSGVEKPRQTDLFSAGFQAALADIIDAVSEEAPLVIAVEDCQWIDPSSAAILAALTQSLRTQRILLIFTSRLDYRGSLSEHPFSVATMELPALDERVSEELIHTIVRQEGRTVSPSYLARCTTVAEGNPFFLNEFAVHWLETADEQASPPSLTAVLKQRLSRVSPRALQLLQTCVVLENHASIDNIEAVLCNPPHELLHSINELSSAGMLTVTTADSQTPGGARLSSRHDLLSDVALMLLGEPAKMFLHRRAAKVLEAHIEQGGDASTLWSCAKHWQLAGDTPQAFRLAMSCATHLLEAGLPNEAASAYAKAEKYSLTDADLLTVLDGKANAHYRATDWLNVSRTIADARTLKRKLKPDLTDHDELELMQLRADWQTLDWNRILERSLDCLHANEASTQHRVEAGVMALMMLSFSGDGTKAASIFETVVALGTDPSVGADSLLQAKMVFHTHWGSFVHAIDAARALVEHNRAGGDVGRTFRSLCNAAVTLRAAGKFEDARAGLEEALELAERHHLYLSKSRATPMLANLALELGQNDDAKRWFDELRNSPIAADDSLAKEEISAIGTRMALIEGRFEDARLLLDKNLAHMRFDQVPQRRTYRAALRVAVELACDGKASIEGVYELEAAFIMNRKNVFQTFASYALYVGLISLGQSEAAESILKEYLTIHRREPWSPPRHSLEMMSGWIRGAAARGDRKTQCA